MQATAAHQHKDLIKVLEQGSGKNLKGGGGAGGGAQVVSSHHGYPPRMSNAELMTGWVRFKVYRGHQLEFDF